MSSKTAAVPEPNDDNEPSMEEILASIRKIIADDSLGTKKNEPMPKKAAAPKAPEPPPAAEPDIMIADPEPVAAAEDVLDLAEVALVAEPRDVDVPVPPAPEPEAVEMFEPKVVDVDLPPAAPAPVRPVADLEGRILSEATGSMVGQAFQTLSRHTAMPAAGRSLEDVVSELLRPMLRDWLDENLPGIVEKLVKTEIERVSRGG